MTRARCGVSAQRAGSSPAVVELLDEALLGQLARETLRLPLEPPRLWYGSTSAHLRDAKKEKLFLFVRCHGSSGVMVGAHAANRARRGEARPLTSYRHRHRQTYLWVQVLSCGLSQRALDLVAIEALGDLPRAINDFLRAPSKT
jgi:hypothetical protein